MKKSTKSEKPAAPQAKKTVAKKASVGTAKAVAKTVAPAKPVVTPAAPVVKKTATKKAVLPAPTPAPVVVAAPVKKVAAKKAPAPKKAVAPAPVAPAPAPAPAVVETIITAKIDVGFGNTLFLRGEGPDLSWDAGLPLNCVSDTEWSTIVTGATAPVVFKFLINDEAWSIGEDYVVEPGSTVVLEPTF